MSLDVENRLATLVPAMFQDAHNMSTWNPTFNIFGAGSPASQVHHSPDSNNPSTSSSHSPSSSVSSPSQPSHETALTGAVWNTMSTPLSFSGKITGDLSEETPVGGTHVEGNNYDELLTVTATSSSFFRAGPFSNPLTNQISAMEPNLPSFRKTELCLRTHLGIPAPRPLNLWSLDDMTGRKNLPNLTHLSLLAIWGSPNKRLTLSGIYNEIEERYPALIDSPENQWKESIRHRLSMKECFFCISGAGMPAYWIIDVSKGLSTRKKARTAPRTFTPPCWVSVDDLYEDLLGRIFGYLEDDFASLKACSLVCRAWGISTRQYVFRSIQVRPNNYAAFADIMSQSLWPTLIPHVRCFDGHGDPDVIYKESPVFDAIGYLLTHITIRNAVAVSFEFLINIICNSPQLVALAILNVDFPLPNKVKYDGRFLPRSIRRVRLRQTPLTPFFTWFIAHPELPPLTHLDFGGVDEHNLFPSENVLALALPTLQHITFSFVPGAFVHACSDGCDALANIAKMHPPRLHPNAAHFRQVFGIPHCSTFAAMDTLSVVQFENFVEDDIRPDLVSTAEFLAPRVCASVPGVRLKRVVFGLNISSAAQLTRYNINWPLFDEIFVSDSYAYVQAIEFRNSGRGNLDNIANYISTILPRASARNLLSFRKAESNLLAGHHE